MAFQSDTIYHFYDSPTTVNEVAEPTPSADSSLSFEVTSALKDTVTNQVTHNRFVTSSQNQQAIINPKLIAEPRIAWPMIILLGCLLILAIIRFAGNKTLRNIFQSIQSSKPSLQNDSPAGFTFLLFLLTVLVYSVFTFILLQKFKLFEAGDGDYTFMHFMIIPAIIAVLFIVQLLLARLSGYVFKAKGIAKRYAVNSFKFNAIGAILLLPVLIVSIYDRSLVSMYLAIGLIALLFMFRTVKGTSIILGERKYLLYHFFIYFCTLEILPVLIIIKAISVANQL